MRRRINVISDIRGQRFGHLTVFAYVGSHPVHRGSVWRCRCDCGNEVDKHNTCLTPGLRSTCGCAHMGYRLGYDKPRGGPGRARTDRVGERIDMLEAIEYLNKQGMYRWRCDCGNEVIKDWGNAQMARENFAKGKRVVPLSCGCARYNPGSAKRGRERFLYFEGMVIGKMTVIGDAGVRHPTFRSKCRHRYWRLRCECGVEEERLAHSCIEAFDAKSVMACRECGGKLRSVLHRSTELTFNGVTRSHSEWARIAGISHTTLKDRLQRGWSVEDTLTTPPDLGNASKRGTRYHPAGYKRTRKRCENRTATKAM